MCFCILDLIIDCRSNSSQACVRVSVCVCAHGAGEADYLIMIVSGFILLSLYFLKQTSSSLDSPNPPSSGFSRWCDACSTAVRMLIRDPLAVFSLLSFFQSRRKKKSKWDNEINKNSLQEFNWQMVVLSNPLKQHQHPSSSSSSPFPAAASQLLLGLRGAIPFKGAFFTLSTSTFLWNCWGL